MISTRRFLGLLLCASALLVAQSSRRALIVEPIDESRRTALRGNTRPEAIAQNDAGAAPGSLAMEHMQILMRRSPEQEQALAQAIDALHNPSSPTHHQWLTPAQFAQEYGASQQDLSTTEAWLRSYGFVVNSVSGGMVIDFSGTAEQVFNAFHTAIHYLNVNGTRHVANMSDPQIPSALARAVAGVVSLHDFSPRPMRRAHANFTYTSGLNTVQAMTPADLATIYNLNPLYQAGITGNGQTIAVIEDADLYDPTDWSTFRSAFGLSQRAGTLTTVHPAASSGGTNCGAPGLAGGDDGEAILDAEWAGAAAPDAAIQVASCASTRATFGGLIAFENLIQSANPPSIISLSYGECEAANGEAANAAYAAAYQQAVAEGISVFVAAGDGGAASCDAGATGATHGIGVSAFASTPYNVAVGGTDFSDTYDGTTSTYWSTSNSDNFGSAQSYIPEIPWNDSCAGSLLSSFLGFANNYGSLSLCASSTARQYNLLSVSAGSGGPSGCATGTPATPGVTDGTCQGYARPSWQTGVAGLSTDGVRDLPDLSVFAGTGVWGHYYVICWSDVRNGGAPCGPDPSTWAGAGGTSFGAPIMAGIQALINQHAGGPQGNPNYVYYRMANSAQPVFHPVTRGDIAVNCGGTANCFGATTVSGVGRRGGQAFDLNGALSVSDTSYNPAYAAATGWNFATGLGSVDANQLVMNWGAGR
ncbi:MAG TPA: protease pro-enzyme activation domain-containing protein [Bryobacteraceae bacterium]|nr:protease pro-enzyme activation domain-containing protein [Bryobacteraceae bacterium]